MPAKKFYINLLVASLLSIGLFVALGFFMPVFNYVDFLIYTLVFFIVYNIGLYYLNRLMKRGSGGRHFIKLTLYNVFIKIILAGAIVYAYYLHHPPEDKYFIVPFLICYFFFTLYETYFMAKEARS